MAASGAQVPITFIFAGNEPVAALEGWRFSRPAPFAQSSISAKCIVRKE